VRNSDFSTGNDLIISLNRLVSSPCETSPSFSNRPKRWSKQETSIVSTMWINIRASRHVFYGNREFTHDSRRESGKKIMKSLSADRRTGERIAARYERMRGNICIDFDLAPPRLLCYGNRFAYLPRLNERSDLYVEPS